MGGGRNEWASGLVYEWDGKKKEAVEKCKGANVERWER
jgi:hypothetical protein